MTIPKISICMTTYQGEKYIEQQIESILCQSLLPDEIIVCDDSSSDNTVGIIKSLKQERPIIYLYKNQKRIGVKKNFSKSIKFAKGEYIALSDQDDFWLPSKLELCYNKMVELNLKYSSATPILIFSDLSIADENLKVIKKSMWNYNGVNPNLTKFEDLMLGNVVTGCTIFMNQALVRKIGEIPDNCHMHDFWIALVASVYGVIGFIDEPTILYRQHDNNTLGTSVNNIVNRLFSFFQRKYLLRPFYEQIITFYNLYSEDIPKETKETIACFIKLYNSSYILKRYYFLKYNFLRSKPIFRRFAWWLFAK